MEQIDQQTPVFDDDITVATFSERVAMLRQLLAQADPMAADVSSPAPVTPADDTQPTVDALAQAFRAAQPAERVAYLMRALDDAIAALDVACLLADEFTGDPGAIQALIAARQQATVTGQKGYKATQKKKYARYEDAAPAAPTQTGAPDEASAALFDAYTAFRETQASYQGLYHYRNALAHYLRQPERAIPPAPPTEADDASNNEAG